MKFIKDYQHLTKCFLLGNRKSSHGEKGGPDADRTSCHLYSDGRVDPEADCNQRRVSFWVVSMPSTPSVCMLLRMFTQQGKEDSYTGFLVGPAALAGSGNINHLQNIQSHSLPYGITLKKPTVQQCMQDLEWKLAKPSGFRLLTVLVHKVRGCQETEGC